MKLLLIGELLPFPLLYEIPILKAASLMLRNDVPSVVAKQYRDIVSNE